MRTPPASVALALALACGCGDGASKAPHPASSSASPRSAKGRPGPSARTTASAAQPAPVERTLELLQTTKVEQLLGDFDRHTKKPTSGRTLERFGVAGADLGYPFEVDGKLVFLFGDTIGTEALKGQDAMGRTDARDPESGIALDFYTREDGKFLPFRPVDKSGRKELLLGFEVPVGGIQTPRGTFVAYKNNHTGDEDGSKDGGARPAETDVTLLASFDPATGGATSHCELSRQPLGRFEKIWFHSVDVPDDASPDAEHRGPWIAMYGTGPIRRSPVYLALVTPDGLAACSGVRYFTGLDGGKPRWSEREADASPLFTEADPRIGEVSVGWIAGAERWLMLYDGRRPSAEGAVSPRADAASGPKAILAREATTPWGPWSAPIVVFDPNDGGFGVFIHDPSKSPPDGQAGPMIGKDKDHPETARGGAYAPFLVERWTRATGAGVQIYFTLSVWNPYVVELMRATFRVVR
ncbi:MAG: DUF4185 domain-containing protein [Polyangiaceae bacterium]